MKQIIKSGLIYIVFSLGFVPLSVTAHAEIHSKSKEIIVVEPKSLLKLVLFFG